MVAVAIGLFLGVTVQGNPTGRLREMADAFFKRRVEAMCDVPTPTSLGELKAVQVRRKQELHRILGLDPTPSRTPLHARITGTIPRDGYRIEKLVFESRPRFFVTAHVYVPAPYAGSRAKTRWPVIVNVNGHWAHKKDEDRVQYRCAFEALRGFLAIAIDSPGHSFEGNSLIERRAEGDHNDWALVEGGTNATGYYVWDTMRALDYLAARPDTDMSRVGITGASGGGLATLYAFAADDRFKAAVPVVYMSSMQLAPDNGCLCNHVPGTCQIGDRSDVIAIQAPKPVMLMGAEEDGEFPPDAMRLTCKKMAATWALYGCSGDVDVRIFPGGHDYSQPMREAMIGFFEKHLLGKGDGRPVPQPSIQVIDPESRELLALDPPAPDERTMRDLALESLMRAPKRVSAAEAIAVNGGIPQRSALNLHRRISDGGTALTYDSEPGLVTSAIERDGGGPMRRLTIWVDDGGQDAGIRAATMPDAGERQAFLDILGTGDLAEVQLRYLWYMGRSAPFTGGWQIVRLVDALGDGASRVEIRANGPIASQAAMWASLMDSRITSVTATGCLERWSDVFEPSVSEYAVQPRANLCGAIASLRAQVRRGRFWIGARRPSRVGD